MSTTIAAISTALSPSGIGIVRVSGEDAMNILYKVYRSKGGKKDIRRVPSHTIHYGYIIDEGQVVDEVLVTWMKAPRTFTGEDVAEINCHGGVYALQRVLDTVIKAGAVPAQPGEFTKRAFLCGRIDLSQAEAVMDVISSDSEYALKNSVNQLKGSLREKIVSIRKTILYHLAYIESALDDPEHYELEDYGKTLKEVLQPVMKDITGLKNSFRDGRLMQDGIRTVILGKPNAGKSSIMNLLTGEDRAIVTDVAGTTRDVLEETVIIDGISLKIADTAGIHNTEDVVERIGVSKALDFADQADLLLFVADSSRELDENDRDILKKTIGRPCIVLLNKTDLDSKISSEDIEKEVSHRVIAFSAKDGRGLEELKKEIRDMFFHGKISFGEEIYITSSRHKNELDQAENSLRLVFRSIDDGMPEDFYSIDLQDAYAHLGNIIGESASEDLINEIFSKFCMGK